MALRNLRNRLLTPITETLVAQEAHHISLALGGDHLLIQTCPVRAQRMHTHIQTRLMVELLFTTRAATSDAHRARNLINTKPSLAATTT